MERVSGRLEVSGQQSSCFRVLWKESSDDGQHLNRIVFEKQYVCRRSYCGPDCRACRRGYYNEIQCFHALMSEECVDKDRVAEFIQLPLLASSVHRSIYFPLAQMDLYQLIVSKMILPRDMVLYIAHATLNAIDVMHDMGLAHMDIKTENILVYADGSVRLADMGHCIDIASRLPSMLGKMVDPSTISYLSPACYFPVRCAEDLLSRDVWCAGIVLVILLTLYNPFAQDKNGEDIETPVGLHGLLERTRGVLELPTISQNNNNGCALSTIARELLPTSPPPPPCTDKTSDSTLKNLLRSSMLLPYSHQCAKPRMERWLNEK